MFAIGGSVLNLDSGKGKGKAKAVAQRQDDDDPDDGSKFRGIIQGFLLKFLSDSRLWVDIYEPTSEVSISFMCLRVRPTNNDW